MALVAGVIASPMPTARITSATSSVVYPLCASSVEKATRPIALIARPDPPTSFWPKRIESGAATVEIGIITNVIGRRATAAFRAL